jgi:hypothetical protein
LEDSEDCRGAGRHGNQHVRLRSAQIDCIETICPALAAPRCFEPRQACDSGFPVQEFRTRLQGLTRPQGLTRKSTNSASSAASKDLSKRQRCSGFCRRSFAIRPPVEIHCCCGRAAGIDAAVDLSSGIKHSVSSPVGSCAVIGCILGPRLLSLSHSPQWLSAWECQSV